MVSSRWRTFLVRLNKAYSVRVAIGPNDTVRVRGSGIIPWEGKLIPVEESDVEETCHIVLDY